MHGFFHSISTIGFIFFTIFSGTHHTDVHTDIHKNLTPTPVIQQVNKQHLVNQLITARGTVSKFGQTVTFIFTFPKNGGALQGTVSGACTGTMQGTYSDKNLTGTATASCQVLLISITGTTTFTGEVNKDNTAALLHAKVTAKGATENIDIPVTLSE